jgi:hypothetical protein
VCNSGFNSVAQELQEALQSEIKAEMEVEEENLGGKAPPAMPGFKIEKNGAEFTLRKTYGSEKFVLIWIESILIIGETVLEYSTRSDRVIQLKLNTKLTSKYPVVCQLKFFNIIDHKAITT